MILKLLTEHHLEFLSLKGGCTASFESTLVKMPHCWKSHVTAQLRLNSPKYPPPVYRFLDVLHHRKFVEAVVTCVLFLSMCYYEFYIQMSRHLWMIKKLSQQMSCLFFEQQKFE